MKIKFHCSAGHSLRVDASLTGRRVKCPHCGEVVRVPQTESKTEPQEPQANELKPDEPGFFDELDLPPSIAPLPPVGPASPANQLPAEDLAQSSGPTDFAGPPAVATTVTSAAIASANSGGDDSSPSSPNNALLIVGGSAAMTFLLVGVIGAIFLWGRQHNSTNATESGPQGSASSVATKSTEAKSTKATLTEATLLDGAAVELKQWATDSAINPLDGSLATVNQNHQQLYLYDRTYVTTGKGKVIGPVNLASEPSNVIVKVVGEKALVLVGDRVKPRVWCFDAESLKLVTTIPVVGRRVVWLASSTDKNDPTVMFAGSVQPASGDYFFAQRVGRFDLSGHFPPHWLSEMAGRQISELLVSASGKFAYGSYFTNSVSSTNLPLHDEKIPAPVPGIWKTQFSGPVRAIDPLGAVIGGRSTLFSADTGTELHEYKFPIQCFLENRPVVAGVKRINNGRKPFKYELCLARTDSNRTLHTKPIANPGMPPRDAPNYSYLWREFESESRLYHDAQTDRLVFVAGKFVQTHELKEFGLELEDSTLPVWDGPTTVAVGEPAVGTIFIPEHPDASFAMNEAPDGMLLEGNMLSWSPGETQRGTHTATIQWTAGERTGTTTVTLHVVSQLTRIDRSKPVDQKASSDAVAGNETQDVGREKHRHSSPGPPVKNGRRFATPYPINQFKISNDGKSVIAVSHRYAGSSAESFERSIVTVLDLESGEVEGTIDLEHRIGRYDLDEHFLYLEISKKTPTTDVFVYQREDRTLKRTLSTKYADAFGAFANRIFVCGNVYRVPDLSLVPMTTDGGYGNRPGIARKLMDSIYQRNSAGWVIHGVQYGHERKQPKLIYGFEMFGELHIAPRETADKKSPIWHPDYAGQLSSDVKKQLTTVQWISRRPGEPKKPPQTWTIDRSAASAGDPFSHRINDGALSSHPSFHKDKAYCVFWGELFELDLDTSAQRNLALINIVNGIKLNPDGKTKVVYELTGGTPPYSLNRGNIAGNDGNPNEVTLTIESRESPSDFLLKRLRKQSELRSKSAAKDFSWQGYRRSPGANPRSNSQMIMKSLLAEYTEDTSSRIAQQIGTTVRPGHVLVPIPVRCKINDSEGYSIPLSHWMFVEVKVSDLKRKLFPPT